MSFRRPPWQVQIFQSCKLQARKTTHVLLPTVCFLLCLEIVAGIVTMFILTSNILSVVCYWYFAEFQISTSVPLDKYVKGTSKLFRSTLIFVSTEFTGSATMLYGRMACYMLGLLFVKILHGFSWLCFHNLLFPMFSSTHIFIWIFIWSFCSLSSILYLKKCKRELFAIWNMNYSFYLNHFLKDSFSS